MFKNDFQGGPYVDVYSIQGKDPLAKVKISGSQTSVRKEFDKDLRTFILLIEGEPSRSKIIFPKSSKQSLHLTQRYLVLQLFIYAGRPFSIEVSVTAESDLKQRIIFSSSNREIVITALHAKMPCSVIEQNTWLNLCLDLNDLISGSFEGSNMTLIDSIVVSANCKLKKMFTLKSRPVGKQDIPSKLQTDDNIPLQIIDMNTFFDAGINMRCSTGNAAKRTAPRSNNESSHIAFGSRVRKDSTSSSKALDTSVNSSKLNSSRNDEKLTTSSRFRKDSFTGVKVLGSSMNSMKLSQVDASTEDKKNVAKQQNTDESNEDTQQGIYAGKAFLQPRPPKQVIGRVRRPRVKSADYSKTSGASDLTTQPLSKSADTRRRKISDNSSEHFKKQSRTSLLNNQFDSDERLPNILPEVKLQKRLSQSAISLEHTEKLIKRNSENHFKSLSLNALPQIKRNKRYDNGSEAVDDNEDVFNYKQVDVTFNQLGDDAMIEDYLRKRTTSSCHDDSSMSSSCANSTNSDLFLYFSRPRSVTGHRSHRGNTDAEMEKITEKSCFEFSNAEVIKHTLLPSSSGVSSVSRTSLENEISEANDVVAAFLAADTANDMPNSDTANDMLNSRTVDVNNNETFVVNSSRVENVYYDEEKNLKDSLENSLEIHNSNSITTELVSSSPRCSSPKNELTVGNVNTFTENANTNLQLLNSYQMRDSCESDSMSWLHASDDHSVYISEKNLANRTLDRLKKSPKQALKEHLEERLGSLIVNSKDFETDDGFSDGSDDTCVQPPTKFRNYRYQDEIKSIGETLDLSATIPETPQVGDQSRINSNRDENNNQPGTQVMKLHVSRDEELLDLLFDPVLNCYYDPTTHKYYELN